MLNDIIQLVFVCSASSSLGRSELENLDGGSGA